MNRRIGWAMVGVMLVGFLAFGVMALPAWAQEKGGAPPPPKIDRAVSDAKKGVLQHISKGKVMIDGVTFSLAPGVLVENDIGRSLAIAYLPVGTMEAPVVYWLGQGQAGGQITQMIITEPR
jgi:hypothetical protein